MNITAKIIITDTNIITDLNNAKILAQFVELDNVFISDLLKYDEINSDTGDIKVIDKFKVIEATEKQLLEINSVRLEQPKLSIYDALNYIIARDNDCILATGDNDLKVYSEKHGIEVIRTLRIVELMYENKIIASDIAVKACNLLKNNSSTRIPKDAIDNLIEKIEKDSVIVN